MSYKPLFAVTAAVIAVLLSGNAPAAAPRCDNEYGAHLKARGETFFNFYYFSNFDDHDRCANLQSAIANQQQLVAWLEQCNRGGVRPALRDLVLYSSIPADQAGCGS